MNECSHPQGSSFCVNVRVSMSWQWVVFVAMSRCEPVPLNRAKVGAPITCRGVAPQPWPCNALATSNSTTLPHPHTLNGEGNSVVEEEEVEAEAEEEEGGAEQAMSRRPEGLNSKAVTGLK
jgi:hypothetical protein